jgi:MtN3 and saliva related transmembrane protein
MKQARVDINSLNGIAIIGLCAAVASTASFAPQAWRLISTRDVKGLSTGMYLLTVTSFALWMTYGLLRGDWALIVPNMICLVLSGFILTMLVLPSAKRDQVADAVEDIATPGSK